MKEMHDIVILCIGVLDVFATLFKEGQIPYNVFVNNVTIKLDFLKNSLDILDSSDEINNAERVISICDELMDTYNF